MTLALEVFSQQLKAEFNIKGTDSIDYDDEEEEMKASMTGEGRVQRVLEIPQAAVGLIAGKAGKKLYALRKKSGAYISLISKNNKTSKGLAKLSISGTAIAVETALNSLKQSLADYDVDHPAV
jgi:hypothetical protein